MQVIADTHVHFYPHYEIRDIFHSAICNFKSYQIVGAINVLFLTENKSNCYFDRLNTDKENNNFNKLKVEIKGPGLLEISNNTADRLLVVNGRQFVSAEGLEVLGLTYQLNDMEGRPLAEIIAAINEKGAIPVLSWSPGKWMFERGKKVLEILENSSCADFLIGDICMRARVTPEPKQMKLAQQKKFRIIAGSDPLPIKGEERFIGSYVNSFELEDNWIPTLESLQNMLKTAKFKTLGREIVCLLPFCAG